MKAKEMNMLLEMRFPELKNTIVDEISWQEGYDTGAHTVYGDVLYPYLQNAIQINDINVIEKIFSFIEEILVSNDDYGVNVVQLSVLEGLVVNGEIKNRMGRATRDALEATE